MAQALTPRALLLAALLSVMSAAPAAAAREYRGPIGKRGAIALTLKKGRMAIEARVYAKCADGSRRFFDINGLESSTKDGFFRVTRISSRAPRVGGYRFTFKIRGVARKRRTTGRLRFRSDAFERGTDPALKCRLGPRRFRAARK